MSGKKNILNLNVCNEKQIKAINVTLVNKLNDRKNMLYS